MAARTRKNLTANETAEALRAAALKHPNVEEGIACQGTALECSAFKTRKKTFFFLGRSEVRLKLSVSQDEARQLASTEPGRYRVGSQGWVTVKLGEADPPAVAFLTRWIDESYQVMAGTR